MQHQEISSKQGRAEKRALPPVVSQLAEMYHLGKFTVHSTFTDYSVSGILFACLLSFLSGLFFSAAIFLAFYAISTGVVILILFLIAFGVIPLLVLGYLVGKRAAKADDGDSATVYFYQQGLVYLHKAQPVALRWEEIERIDIIYGPVRRCQVALADSGNILLINGVRGGLSQEIRRRVMRYRKKHQHHSAIL